jgi:hypothetical protein
VSTSVDPTGALLTGRFRRLQTLIKSRIVA